ncbi:MAG: hypothetical protein A2Z12_03905 [Actinobacteria bacterium RBG_16_68_21]|nr:MAG: hypothetical protein A2Z12_03905 [Actinobacteria bacterium RBG_16_68_21]
MIRKLGRALVRRCPNCGASGIFDGYATLGESCPACRLTFERHEGYWVGAVAVNTVVTLGVFVGVLVGAIVLTWPDPPWTAILITTVILNVLFPIAFYPFSKTLWMALELTFQPVNELPQPPETA